MGRGTDPIYNPLSTWGNSPTWGIFVDPGLESLSGNGKVILCLTASQLLFNHSIPSKKSYPKDILISPAPTVMLPPRCFRIVSCTDFFAIPSPTPKWEAA